MTLGFHVQFNGSAIDLFVSLDQKTFGLGRLQRICYCARRGCDRILKYDELSTPAAIPLGRICESRYR
jgi:hypothetical protein